MKIRILKLLLGVVLVAVPRVAGTNSYFSDTATITGNTFSVAEEVRCEQRISEPELTAPEDHAWLDENDVTFRWRGSEDRCGKELEYKLEAFENDNLHGTPVFSSNWQTGTEFNQNDIAEKHIFWRVLVRDGDGNTETSDVFHLNFKEKCPPPPLAPMIVINEFLPNPDGADDADRPSGEWVELFNKSTTTSYGLNKWWLEDDSGHKLKITDKNATALVIPPLGFVTVYRDGNNGFSLNNDAGGDTIYLKDESGTMIDSHSYSAILGEGVIEGKSIAQIPDGSGNWFDPIPTPNGPNKLGPAVSLSVTPERQYFSFKVEGVTNFITIDYELTYETDNGTRGVKGLVNLDGSYGYDLPQTILGSCSSGGTCVFDTGVKKLILKLTLKRNDGGTESLSQTLD